MNTFDFRQIRRTADERLGRASYNPRKLAVLHIGVVLGITVLTTLLDILLTRQIDNTGGLSGMQIRSVLQTMQSVLQMVSMFVLPLWNVGIYSASICLAREWEVGPASLLEGFRRFGPVLRLMILRSMLVTAMLFLCANVGTTLYLFTPGGQGLMEQMMGMMTPEALMGEEMMLLLADHLPGLMIPFGIVAALVNIPLLLRLRLADYLVLDGQNSAIRAMVGSWKLTRGNTLKLLRLDLSFWWFHLLLLLSEGILFADVLAQAMGQPLPGSVEAVALVCYLVYALVQLGLYWWAGSRVHTAAAVAYDTLVQLQEAPVSAPAPQNVPWDY